MRVSGAQATVQELLAQADVTINGDNAWDIRVHNDDLYSRLLSGGALALGESYMEEWWDCESLDQFIYKVLRANLDQKVKINFRLAWHVLKAKLFNLQKPDRAYQVGEEHYDIGNDLYSAMLDQRMLYTCGYWAAVDNLDAAQEAKLDLGEGIGPAIQSGLLAADAIITGRRFSIGSITRYSLAQILWAGIKRTLTGRA